jgi:hypothetical protein
MRSLILALPVSFSLAGCAPAWDDAYWFKPGATHDEFARAEFDCGQSAFTRFPPMTFGKPGYFSTGQSYCSPTPGGTNCIQINPGYLPQAQPANDTNEPPREQAFAACMAARGWHPDPHPGWSFAASPPGMPHPSQDAVRAARGWCERHLKRNDGGTIPADELDQCIVNRATRAG